jgi:hypothetical protein
MLSKDDIKEAKAAVKEKAEKARDEKLIQAIGDAVKGMESLSTSKVIGESIQSLENTIKKIEIPKNNTKALLDGIERISEKVGKSDTEDVISSITLLLKEMVKNNIATSNVVRKISDNNGLQDVIKEVNRGISELKGYMESNTKAEWEHTLERNEFSRLSKIKSKRLK